MKSKLWCFWAFVLIASVVVGLPATPASADSASIGGVTCSATTGQLSATVTNTGLTSTYKLSVGGKVASTLIGGGKTKTITASGIPNGTHTAKVLLGGNTLRTKTVTVSCAASVAADTVTIHGESCASNAGRVSATVKNNSSSTRTYKLSVGGRVGSTLIGGGKTGTITASSIPDGTHTSKVLFANTTLKQRSHLISCAPSTGSGGSSGGSSSGGTTGADDGLVPVEADQGSVNNPTCSGGSGSLKANIWNNSNSQRTYTFEILGGASKQTVISANGFGTITISGISDGGWATYIKHGSTIIAQISKSVSCAPTVVPDTAIFGAVKCISGAGQLTVTITNNSTATRTYKLSVGGKVASKLIGAGNRSGITVSGLANGSHTAKALLGTKTLKQRTVSVSCAPIVVPDSVSIGSASCVSEAGRVSATVKNNSRTTRTYKLSVAGKVASKLIGGGNTATITASGIANGTHTANVFLGTKNLQQKRLSVSCVVTETASIWTAVTCTNGKGRVGGTVNNNGTASRTYTMSAEGKVASKVVTPRSYGVLTIAGVSNGSHVVKITRGSRTLKQQTVAVSCVPDVVSITPVTCVNGVGRVSATIKNNGTATSTYKVSIGGKVGSKVIGGGRSGTVTVDGVSNGRHTAKVLIGTLTIKQQTLTVSCDPPDVIWFNSVTCSSGTGRVSATVKNNSATTRTYKVSAGGKVGSKLIGGGKTGTVTAVGVANGSHQAKVLLSNRTVKLQTVKVACVLPDVVSIGSATCVDGAGRVTATMKNNSATTRTYKLSVGGKVDSRLIGGGKTGAVAIAGLPNGNHIGKILLGTSTLTTKTVPVTCAPLVVPDSVQQVTVSCSGAESRVFVQVRNNSSGVRTYTANVGGKVNSQAIVAGGLGFVTVSDVPNGNHTARVTRGTTVVGQKSVTVSCTAPVVPDTATFGSVTCVDDAGRIWASVKNNSSSTRTYKLSVGGKVVSRLLGGNRSTTITAVGIPDGTHVAKVLMGTTTVRQQTVSVACSNPADVTWAAGHTCLSQGNRAGMRADVTNNGSATSTYVVEMLNPADGSTVHGSHGYPIGAGKTGEVLLGGIPTGTYVMRVLENSKPLTPTKTVTFPDCELPTLQQCNTGAGLSASACPWTSLPSGDQGDIIITRYWDGPHPTWPDTQTATFYEYYHVDREANWTVILTFVGAIPVVGELVDIGFCIYDSSQAIFSDGSYLDAAVSCGAALMPLASAAAAKKADDVFEVSSDIVRKGGIPDEIPNNLQEQVALSSAKSGTGEVIIRNLGDAPRLIDVYGPGEWVKMQNATRLSGIYEGETITLHWFRNLDTGQNVEFKFTSRLGS